MTEGPILFSGPMVRAILEGRKTQTRRVVKPSGLCVYDQATGQEVPGLMPVKCPYGLPGDRLWVRETWGAPDCDRPGVPDGRTPKQGDRIVYQADEADAWQWRSGMPWRPSIHMPRWASRITLEATGVRVERLQEISRGDAMGEGCPFPNMSQGPNPCDWFAELWDSINGKGSWNGNPWVWVIEFKRLEAAHD